MNHTVDTAFFPGWVRKSICFTIDDGNLQLDKKFLGYVKPAGIKGTFNLTTPLRDVGKETYLALYEGYEIANHCRYHAYCFNGRTEARPLKDQLFPAENPESADKTCMYPTGEKGVYRIHTYAWTYIADEDTYLALARDCQNELESVFGKGRVKGYIYPCGRQGNPAVEARLAEEGYGSLRATGCVKDSTGFAMPCDRNVWSYNANNMDLLEVAEKYEDFPDDGTLKFFCFGVHSHDFENAGNWNVLEEFCRRYGNRPETYYSASVGDLFAYEDAVKQVRITNDAVENPSDVDLYIKIDGVRVSLPRHSTVLM